MIVNFPVNHGENAAILVPERLLAAFNIILIPLLIFILRRFSSKPDTEAETPIELYDEVATTHEDDPTY